MHRLSAFSSPDRRRRLEAHRRRRDAFAGQGRASSAPARVLRAALQLTGLGLTAAVVAWGIWSTLGHRSLPAQQEADALWNIHENAFSLTPDNIERWILSQVLRARADEIWSVPGEDAEPVPFTIYPGEPALYVSYRLANEGFVTDAQLFNLYMWVEGLDHYLTAGNFLLTRTMTMPELATALQSASYEEVSVTIPEGLRTEQVAQLLAENYVIDAEEFMAAVQSPRSLQIFDDYPFLYDLPPDDTLEGFLFPDTYRFPIRADSVETVAAKFLNNFDAKFGGKTDVRRGSTMNMHELVTIASIVEREAFLPEEQALVSSVYYNRLEGRCNDQVAGPYLQADPTVQYAAGSESAGWWPSLTLDDLTRVESPYNTFLHPGLPPGPIANPGLGALTAAWQPAVTVYCFFHTSGPGGGHAFARTYAEHEQNMQRYGN